MLEEMGLRLRTLGVLAVLLVLCRAAGARSTVFDDDEEEGTARSDQHVATVPLEHAFGVRMSLLAACCCCRRLQCAGGRLRSCGCHPRLRAGLRPRAGPRPLPLLPFHSPSLGPFAEICPARPVRGPSPV